MAEFKFFNIGKANAEIVRLEGEVTKAQAEAKAATDNAAEIEAAAETAQNDLKAARAELEPSRAAVNTISARAEKAEADLKTANEKLANPDARIEQAASRRAQEITAGQGQPPIPATPSVDPAKAEAAPASNLTGMDRVVAALKSENAAKNSK